MRVVVPHTEKRSAMLGAVQVCLMHERCKPRYELMKGDNDYYELVKSLWAEGKPFIINEHDVIAWPGAIAQLQECPEPWCTFAYRAGCGWVNNALGLVKFDPLRLLNVFADITC